jgi:hypothetical protein
MLPAGGGKWCWFIQIIGQNFHWLCPRPKLSKIDLYFIIFCEEIIDFAFGCQTKGPDWRHDIQHNDIKYNDTQQKGVIWDIQHSDTQHKNTATILMSLWWVSRVLFIVMRSVIMLSIIMLNIVMLSVVMLDIIQLSIFMLSVVMLSVFMPNVVAPPD